MEKLYYCKTQEKGCGFIDFDGKTCLKGLFCDGLNFAGDCLDKSEGGI